MESPGERSVQAVALNNPIILTEILKQSSSPLKNCRLVSHFWNEMVLSLPNTRLELNLDSNKDHENDPFPFFELCYKLDDRLAKRISANTLHRTEGTYSFAAKLMHVCDKFSDRVQLLDLGIHDEDCLPSIFQVLKNSCPNLKQLLITCVFNEEEYVPSEEIQELPQKPNLTVFELNSEVVAASPTLTRFAQLVVNASPNLRKLEISWGVYPDLETSKSLDSLTLHLDDVRPLDVALRDLKPSEVTLMLGQVGDQLVHLAFAYCRFHQMDSMKEKYNLDNSTQRGIRLPGKMSKLRTFQNVIIDIIQHADFWEDIERMPVLESLTIGKVSKTKTSVDTILKNLQTKRIFAKVTDLWIKELYDPRLLDGLKMAFPNLKILMVHSMHKKKEGGLELGVALKACAGLGRLDRLYLWVPTYPERTWDAIKALLDGAELYKELNILKIRTHRRNRTRHDLTDGEMDLFKGLLVAMKRMDSVIIHDLKFVDESQRNILDFMASNEMPVSRFRVVRTVPYDGGI